MTQPSPPADRARLALTAIAAFVVVLAVGAAVWFAMSQQAGGSAGIGGPFTLEDGSGKTVTDRDFHGRYLLVYFGYTFCPDVCPTTLNAVAAAFDKLGAKADKVQALFITVDPGRDTPKVVQQYAAAFSPHIMGLTGTPDEIARVAREYRVYYARHQDPDAPGGYTMDHSSILYLMGPDGHFIEPIRADQTGAAMAADLSKALG
jgi:protein SCO1